MGKEEQKKQDSHHGADSEDSNASIDIDKLFEHEHHESELEQLRIRQLQAYKSMLRALEEFTNEKNQIKNIKYS